MLTLTFVIKFGRQTSEHNKKKRGEESGKCFQMWQNFCLCGTQNSYLFTRTVILCAKNVLIKKHILTGKRGEISGGEIWTWCCSHGILIQWESVKTHKRNILINTKNILTTFNEWRSFWEQLRDRKCKRTLVKVWPLLQLWPV